MSTFEYSGTCGACGASTRRMFVAGKGKNAKRQRPKWWRCNNGHRVYRKLDQIGRAS